MIRGWIARDESAYGLVIEWEVWKLLPFAQPGEQIVLRSGKASSWAAAGKQLGVALEEVQKERNQK